jgi:hypothetical protein
MSANQEQALRKGMKRIRQRCRREKSFVTSFNDVSHQQARAGLTPRRSFLIGSAAAAGAATLSMIGGEPAHAESNSDFTGPGNLGEPARLRGSGTVAPRRHTQIGIGYETWFDAVGWTRPEAEPILGRYSSLDEKVIRQHASWITYAGIDHIIVDWSNNLGANWTNGTAEKIIAGTDKLFDVYSTMRASERPQITILVGIDNGKAGTTNFQAQIEQIKTKYLDDARYKGLLVRHEGRPLLTIYTGARTTAPPSWSDQAFTVRWMGAFREIVLNPGGQWSWVDRLAYANGPETPISTFDSTQFAGWSADSSWRVGTVKTQPAFNISLDQIIATSEPVNGAGQSTGKLTSPVLTITERFLSFNAIGFDMSAGADLSTLEGRNVYLLKDAATGQILRTATPPGDPTRMYVRQWNVGDLMGRRVVFQAVNNSSAGGGLGWFGFSALVQQRPEQVTAVVANGGNEAPGSYANWDSHNRNSGAYLVEMMAGAFKIEPEFLVIQQWNEFGRPDQYGVASSNDIEPTKITRLAGSDSDGWGFYYLKLVRDIVDQYRAGAAFPSVALDTRYP